MALRRKQMQDGEKDEKSMPAKIVLGLSDRGVADEDKHGAISKTDLIMKGLVIFGSAALVISVILYLIL